MKFIFIILIMVNSVHCFAGEWRRVDEATLDFSGSIEADEYQRFQLVFDEKVEKLIVNTGGGETMAAIKIATDLFFAKIEISVEGACLSSCANYFFTAASKRVINGGIVGYHGNMKACFTGENWKIQEEEMLKSGISKEKIEEIQQIITNNIPIEKEFLRMVDVPQAIFDISCTPDKGVGDGGVYSLLLPLPDTFEKFGIHGVIGEQNLELANKLSTPPAVW